jgi:SAM-dependent methyltransferase
MMRNSSAPWVCPSDLTPLLAAAERWTCPRCDVSFPVVGDIPRFVQDEGYGDNFGLEWLAHARTQLDSHTGLSLSRDRFFESTRWTPSMLAGHSVLEVGCGAGRFTEVVLSTGARLTSLDLSRAVEANLANNGGHASWSVAQADLFHLPLRPASFDFVFCFGVLQHTPDPRASFHKLLEYVRPGGHFAVDVYPKDWRAYIHWKYYLRPFTRRLPPERLYRLVRRLAPLLMRVSTPLGRIPRLGRHLQRAVPVADYSTWLPVPREQLVEWAILDTFDWFSPTYDQPQSRETLERWVQDAGLEETEIFQRGFYVVRGRRPAAIVSNTAA